MKLNLLLLLLLSLFTFACDSEEVTEFPSKFQFSKTEFENSKIFIVNSATKVQEIPASGEFIEFDNVTEESMTDYIEDKNFIKIIELLDDVNATVTYNDDVIRNATYTKNGDVLSLKIGTLTFDVNLKLFSTNGSNNIIKMSTLTSIYSFEDDYSPISVDLNKSSNLVTLAEEIAKNNKLKTNDTIALRICQLVYEKK